MIERLFGLFKRYRDDKWTGSITIHWAEGVPLKIDEQRKFRVEDIVG